MYESLLTILASGITAAIVSHVLTARKEERLLIRDKLEQLHMPVHNYLIGMGVMTLPFLQAMRGTIDYNQALDMQIKDGPAQDKEAFPTIQRLIGIYFPDLQNQFDELLASRERINVIRDDFKYDYLHGAITDKQWHKQFSEELIRFEAIAEKLKKSIVDHPIHFGQKD